MKRIGRLLCFFIALGVFALALPGCDADESRMRDDVYLSDFGLREDETPEQPKFDMPEFDVPEFDVPEFDIPEFDVPEMEWPEFELPEYDWREKQLFDASSIKSFFSGFGFNKISIPDITNVDEETAKSILSSNALIPFIAYEYDDGIAAGNVIRTEPPIGTEVAENSRVCMYISKGPSKINSVDSRITWQHVSSSKDDWAFYAPYIEEDVLYIYCDSVKFGKDVQWKDTYGRGYIIGVASTTESFEKSVPVRAKYSKQNWKAGEEQAFTLEIPLADLGDMRPTNLSIELYTENVGDVKIAFTMNWQ